MKIEKGVAIAFAVCFGLAFFAGIYFRFKNRRFDYHDAFGLLFILLVLLYFNLPGYLAGGAFFVERLQFIIYLILLLWLASITVPKTLGILIGTAACIVNIILVSIRTPVIHEMSEGVEELLEVTQYIEEESTVLPLSYNHNGCKINGEYISDNFWMFMHVGDYIGTEKAIVTLGNYEANTGYFPLNYREEKNPYLHLGDVEGQPPNPDILEYPKRTTGTIDYIVLWCFEDSYSELGSVKRTFEALDSDYTKIYISSNGRVVLYRHNSL